MSLDRLIVPGAASAVAAAVEGLEVPLGMDPFVCSLEVERVESAYRGAATTAAPRFHGFDLLDAAERARDHLAQLHAQMAAVSARTFAVPFLWLRYECGGKSVSAVVRRRMDGTHVARLG